MFEKIFWDKSVLVFQKERRKWKQEDYTSNLLSVFRADTGLYFFTNCWSPLVVDRHDSSIFARTMNFFYSFNVLEKIVQRSTHFRGGFLKSIAGIFFRPLDLVMSRFIMILQIFLKRLISSKRMFRFECYSVCKFCSENRPTGRTRWRKELSHFPNGWSN